MSSRRIKQIEADIANAEKKRNYSKLLEYYLQLAQELSDDQNYERAKNVYNKAAGVFQKITNPTEEDRDNEFMRLRKLVEIFTEETWCNPDRVKENFKKYIDFAEQPAHRLLRRVQIAYHVGAYCFHAVNPINVRYLKKALKYAHKSLDLLKKHSKTIDLELKAIKDTDDSVRRRSGIYTVLGAIYYDLEDLKNAVKYNEEALNLERHHPDIDLRYRILFSKHGFVSRCDRLEIAEQLYSLIEKHNRIEKHHKEVEGKAVKELWVSRKRELLPIIAQDVLIDGKLSSQMQQERLDRSEAFLWELYKLNKDDFLCQQGLVMIEILRQNQTKIDLLRQDVNPDWRAIAALYEESGDRATSFNAFEMAEEYYEQMRQCALKLFGDIKYGDLELSRLATCSLAETYMELRDFKLAARFFDDLVQIEMLQNRYSFSTFETRLSAVIAKSKCAEYSFQEKLVFYEQLLAEAKGYSKKRTLEKLIEFLERDSNATKDQLQAYKADFDTMQSIKDEDPPDAEEEKTDFGEKDEVIFDQLVKRYEYKKLVEEYALKRDKVNSHGETELIQAAKTKPLKFIKMLVEECCYDIDARDSAGWTALSEAVTHRRIDVVRFLIKNKANPNTQSTETLIDEKTGNHATAEGATPLMEACINGDLGIIDILLEGGADVLLKNGSGWTAADYIDEYLKINASDDESALNQELRLRSIEMRKKEIEAGVAAKAKKPDLPQKTIPIALVTKKSFLEVPGVSEYQKAIEDLGARTKTSAIKAAERDVTSLNLSDDEFGVPEKMGVDPYPLISRPRPLFHSENTEDSDNDIIMDDVVPGRMLKRSSSGHPSSSAKRMRTLDTHFNQVCLMNTPPSSSVSQHQRSMSSSVGKSSNSKHSATGSLSQRTTPTHMGTNTVIVNITFIDPVSKLPIASVNPTRCSHQTTIMELCTGVQELVVNDNYDEILPHRGDLPLKPDDTVGDALRGVIVRSFELNLHLKGWTPSTPKLLFQRRGLAINDSFSKYLSEFRNKHWTFSGLICVSRIHFPIFLQCLALILSRVDVITVSIGPDPLVKNADQNDTNLDEPSKLNFEVAKWLGILLRDKPHIEIYGDAVEDVWLERISIQDDTFSPLESLTLKRGHYNCRSLAFFLEHCGSLVTLNLSFTELTASSDASWDTIVDRICRFSRLKTLRLTGTRILTHQVQRILNVCPNLENLDIASTSVDFCSLKSDYILQLKVTNMITKPSDLSPVSTNFKKLIQINVSFTSSIAEVLRGLGYRNLLIVARFCPIGDLTGLSFTEIKCTLAVHSCTQLKLVQTGFPISKFSHVSEADMF